METKINYEKVNYSAIEVYDEITIKENVAVKLANTFAAIKDVITVFSKIKSIEANMSGGFLEINGVIQANILYVSDENEIISFCEDMDFSSKKKLPFDKDSALSLCAKITHLSWQTSSSRSVSISFTVNCLVYEVKNCEHDVFSSLEEEGEYEVSEESVSLSYISVVKSSNVFSFDIPNDSSITEPVYVSASLKDIKENQSENGILIYGVLDVAVIGRCESAGDDPGYTCVRGSYAINHFIEKPIDRDYSQFVNDADFEIKEYELSYDESGSVIKVTFDFNVKTMFICQNEMKQIQDMFLVRKPSDILMETSYENARCEKLSFDIEFEEKISLKKKFEKLWHTDVALFAIPRCEGDDVVIKRYACVTFLGLDEKGKIISESVELSLEDAAENANSCYGFVGVTRAKDFAFNENTGEIKIQAVWEGIGVKKAQLKKVSKIDVLDSLEKEYTHIKVHFKTADDDLFCLAKASLVKKSDILKENNLESLDDTDDGTPIIIY